MENNKKLEVIDRIWDLMRDFDFCKVEVNINYIGVYITPRIRLNCIRQDKMKLRDITLLDGKGKYIDDVNIDDIERIYDFINNIEE